MSDRIGEEVLADHMVEAAEVMDADGIPAAAVPASLAGCGIA